MPDRTMAVRSAIVALLMGLAVSTADADSGAPVGVRTYSSGNGEFHLTVDPRWNENLEMRPLLTLARGEGEFLWERRPDEFEDFHFPLQAWVSDDGQYLVFAGIAVHNVGHYREGLRFYDATGRLLHYYSRRDLPPGRYTVSTAWWYDEERSRVVGDRFLLHTPKQEAPTVFGLATGEVLEGSVISGQGDDEKNWRLRWRQDDGDR